MKKNRLVHFVFILACFLLLTSQSCWDFVLEKRVCPTITVELEVDGGVATIPDCDGEDPLLTVKHRETFNFVGLDENLLSYEVVDERNPFASFRLTSTGVAQNGDTTSFVIDFDPKGRGRRARPFDQEIEVLVIFNCTPGENCPPAEPPVPEGCSPEPVPRDQVCETLQAAVSSWLQRCNPELAEIEANRLAEAQVCGDPNNPFEDEDIEIYDSVAAQNCGCDIKDMPCSGGDPFSTLQTCKDMLVGPLGLGVQCERDVDCASDYCMVVDGCSGVCETILGAGEPCIDPVFGSARRCEPGYFCDESQDEPTCTALSAVGEFCSEDVPCAGSVDYFFFPTVECDEISNTCQAVIKDGASCNPPPCHGLYTCAADTLTCVALPGDKEACELSIDITEPTHEQWVALIAEAGNACRLSPDLYGTAGEYCVQNGPTSGNGECQTLPALGEACGLGSGLSPRCAPGAYCDALDASAFGLVTGTCVAGKAADEECDSDWQELGLGSQCASGYACIDGHCQLTCLDSEDEGGF